MKRFLSGALACLMLLAAHTVWADTDEVINKSAIEQRLLELELQVLEMQRQHAEQMEVLSKQIQMLKQELKTTTEGAVSRSKPAAALPQDNVTGQAGVAGGNIFNPKITVIADMVAAGVSQDDDTANTMQMREVEIGFSGHVDTWGRFDMTTTIHNHLDLGFGHGHDHDHEGEEAHEHGGGLELEEGYFTFLTLPGGFQARVGKFRAQVGKTNTYHPHSLPWTEYPLAMRSYLGEEGLIGTGVSLNWLAPWEQYTEFTYEFYKANSEADVGVAEMETDEYSHLFRGNTFFDLTGSATFELGATSLLAPAESSLDVDDTWLNAADFTFRWAPFGDGSYRSFEWRTEIFGLRKTLLAHHDHDEDDHDHDEDDHDHDEHGEDEHEEDHDHEEEGELSRETMLGLYSSLAYRFNRWWEAGLRYDYAEGPFDLHQEETEYGVFLTWWQSEYAYWRVNLVRNELTLDDIEAEPLYKMYLQFNLSLGPHPAHKY